MRPLYLNGGGPLEVAVDGPSLVVRLPQQAERRFPFRLLSRVVVRGDVALPAAVLTACLAQGVPVALLTGTGRPLGFCLPALPRRTAISHLLDLLLSEPEGPDRYKDWLASRERRAILDLPRRLGLPPFRDLRPRSVRASLERHLARHGLGRIPALAVRGLTALLDAEVTERLARDGVEPRHLGRLGDRLDLRRDFLRLLAWELWPAADRLLDALARAASRAGPPGPPAPERLARHYAALAPRIDKLYRQHLGALRLWLLEATE